MKATVVVMIGLLVVACGRATADAPEPAGPHAAAVHFALERGHGEDNDLVYVVEPRPERWDQWCKSDADLTPCRALAAMTIDLGAPFPFDAAADIDSALAPRDVEFIDDPESVIDPAAGPMLTVKDDAGRLSFGRAIEVDGKIYLPVDALLEGWLLELTPTDQGWDIDVLAQWIA